MTLKSIDNLLVKLGNVLLHCIGVFMLFVALLLPLLGVVIAFFITEWFSDKLNKDYPGIKGLVCCLMFLSLTAFQTVFIYFIYIGGK